MADKAALQGYRLRGLWYYNVYEIFCHHAKIHTLLNLNISALEGYRLRGFCHHAKIHTLLNLNISNIFITMHKYTHY